MKSTLLACLLLVALFPLPADAAAATAPVQAWSYNIAGEGAVSETAVLSGTLFAVGHTGASGDLSYRWTVVALDPKTGSEKWVYTDTVGPGTATSVAAGAGSVFVAGYHVTNPDPFTYPARVESINPRNAALKWSWTDTDATHQGSILRAMVLQGSTLFAAGDAKLLSGDNVPFIIAFDAKTGNVKWTYQAPTGPNIQMTQLAVGKTLVALGQKVEPSGTQNTTVIALVPKTGIHKWTSQDTDVSYNGYNIALTAKHAIIPGARFVGTNHWEARVRAFDLTTGSVAWTATQDSGTGQNMFNGVTLVGQNVVAVGALFDGGHPSGTPYMATFVARNGNAASTNTGTEVGSYSALLKSGSRLLAVGTTEASAGRYLTTAAAHDGRSQALQCLTRSDWAGSHEWLFSWTLSGKTLILGGRSWDDSVNSHFHVTGFTV